MGLSGHLAQVLLLHQGGNLRLLPLHWDLGDRYVGLKGSCVLKSRNASAPRTEPKAGVGGPIPPTVLVGQHPRCGRGGGDKCHGL